MQQQARSRTGAKQSLLRQGRTAGQARGRRLAQQSLFRQGGSAGQARGRGRAQESLIRQGGTAAQARSRMLASRCRSGKGRSCRRWWARCGRGCASTARSRPCMPTLQTLRSPVFTLPVANGSSHCCSKFLLCLQTLNVLSPNSCCERPGVQLGPCCGTRRCNCSSFGWAVAGELWLLFNAWSDH